MTAKLAAIIALSCLGGCAGMSREDHGKLQDEVAKNVSVGMPVAAALAHLGEAGFRCDSGGAAPRVRCDRIRDNILLYSCVQHAGFTVDGASQTVNAVESVEIACAGM